MQVETKLKPQLLFKNYMNLASHRKQRVRNDELPWKNTDVVVLITGKKQYSYDHGEKIPIAGITAIGSLCSSWSAVVVEV